MSVNITLVADEDVGEYLEKEMKRRNIPEINIIDTVLRERFLIEDESIEKMRRVRSYKGKYKKRVSTNEMINILVREKMLVEEGCHEITTNELEGTGISEMAVIFLMGRLWKEISQKYNLISIKEFYSTKYPDAIILRKAEDGSIIKCTTEFEAFSSNFLLHNHPKNNCDIIICWKHDWIKCPSHIEVIELYNMVNKDENILIMKMTK